MQISEARYKANKRYNRKTYDTFLVKVRKDSDLTLAMVKEHASNHGESTNGFITRAIKETIERDKT